MAEKRETKTQYAPSTFREAFPYLSGFAV